MELDSGGRRRPANAGKKYPPEILTPEEVGALLRACSGRAPTGIRNRALITLLYRAGLRVSEALSLDPKDVEVRAGTVRVLHGKGDRARTVGLDPEAFALIERWLDKRTQIELRADSPVLCTLSGRSLRDSYVRALLPRLGRKAGITKRVHAHGLRHTHAAELAREGFSMPLIQAQLGHSSLATTSRYLAHIQPQELIDAIQARSWIGELE